jgi:hypothetical protein
MFVSCVILVFANCCVDEALRSAIGAVRIFLYRWTISMVATTFDRGPSQLQILLFACVRAQCPRVFDIDVFGLCSMSSPDAVFRTLQAVVLIFFVLSLLVFGALHRHDELILQWWRPQTHRHFANLRFQPLQDDVTSLPAKQFDTLLQTAVHPAVLCSLLWLPPIYAHGRWKFESHTIASR